MKRIHSFSLYSLLAALLLSSCAVTQSSIHAVGGIPPICSNEAKQESALILWGTVWRTNQKEKQLREEKASQAISQFFKTRSCYEKTTILRTFDGRDPVALSDIELIDIARSSPDRNDKIVLLRVEELGPLLLFYLSPILWEGGSEAVIRVRVLDVNSGALEHDVDIHRRNTGAFVLRGTTHLEEDLKAALDQLFWGT